MSAKDVIEKMTEDDVIDIMTELGSEEPAMVRDGMLFNTICHNGEYSGKKKLHYHNESKSFFCYTECHNIGNIFKLVMKVKEIEYWDAYEYVCSKMRISTSTLRHGFREEIIDNSFIRKFSKTGLEFENAEIRDDKVLSRFWKNIFHQSWIDDFISIETMKKFGIRFDVSGNRIIIPHYNEHNELIGIRCRNLSKDKVDDGRKYMPITVNDTLYNYLTSTNLYGLNFNKHNIMKYRKIIIGESEKFVMQHSTFYEDSIAVAISGSALSDCNIETLKKMGVDEVILALDKEFENKEEEEAYKQKIQKSFISKLQAYFTISIIWDNDDSLETKMSPGDKGKDTFEKLYKNKIQVL